MNTIRLRLKLGGNALSSVQACERCASAMKFSERNSIKIVATSVITGTFKIVCAGRMTKTTEKPARDISQRVGLIQTRIAAMKIIALAMSRAVVKS
jgi:hypothetical protein